MGCDGTLRLKHDETNRKKLEKESKYQDEILTEYGANEITLLYKTTGLKKGDKIKLFGEQFVINNKDKCSIIHNNNKYDLTDYFIIPEINKKETLEIKLQGIKSIININNIFSYNYKLISSPVYQNGIHKMLKICQKFSLIVKMQLIYQTYQNGTYPM